MKKSVLIAILAVAIIVIGTAAYLGCSEILNQTQATPTPTPTPEPVIQKTVRDSAIMYIATNHEDITSLTTDLTWTGGRQDTGLVGSDTYIYIAGNWNVTITNPVVLHPTYAVSAVYTDTANQVTIEWQGTYESQSITETSYEYIVP